METPIYRVVINGRFISIFYGQDEVVNWHGFDGNKLTTNQNKVHANNIVKALNSVAALTEENAKLKAENEKIGLQRDSIYKSFTELSAHEQGVLRENENLKKSYLILEQGLADIRRVIFWEMPGRNLDGMGEKYHSKIGSIIGKLIGHTRK